MFMHLLSKVLVVPRKKKFFHFTYPLTEDRRIKVANISMSELPGTVVVNLSGKA